MIHLLKGITLLPKVLREITTLPKVLREITTLPKVIRKKHQPKEKYSTPYISNKTILYLVIVVALVAIAGLTTGSVALSEDSGSGTNANTITANFVTNTRPTGTCVSLLPSNKYAVDFRLYYS